MKTTKETDIFDRIMHLPGIRILEPIYLKYKEVLLYLFFGGLTSLISIGTYTFFDVKCGINVLLANILSWIASVLFAYITNKIWVFRTVFSSPAAFIREMITFFGGRVFTLIIEEVILLIFISVLGFNSVIVKVIAQIIVIILNYVVSKKIVFKH